MQAWHDAGKIQVACESGALVEYSYECAWVARYKTKVGSLDAAVVRSARLFLHKGGTAALDVSESISGRGSPRNEGQSYTEASAGSFAEAPDIRNIRYVRFVDETGSQLGELVRVEVRKDN